MPDDISAQLLEASAEHTDILSKLEESIHGKQKTAGANF